VGTADLRLGIVIFVGAAACGVITFTGCCSISSAEAGGAYRPLDETGVHREVIVLETSRRWELETEHRRQEHSSRGVGHCIAAGEPCGLRN
jgi:hypothetical protein